MRKHRLAERLLLDVIGLEWDQVHIEACRWEHVMSNAVERRILALLEKPLVCPHGNPSPAWTTSDCRSASGPRSCRRSPCGRRPPTVRCDRTLPASVIRAASSEQNPAGRTR
jgi:Mn-dependent DtxR family transcriptional regulator